MSENVNCFLRLSEERDSNGDDYNNDYDLSNLLYLPKLALWFVGIVGRFPFVRTDPPAAHSGCNEIFTFDQN